MSTSALLKKFIKKEPGTESPSASGQSQIIGGREIIQNYLQLTPTSTIQYQRMYQSMAMSFDKWSEEAREVFLKEFFDIYEELDGRFSDFVIQLCKLQWHKIPKSIRADFVNFLASLAIHHVYHISTVFGSFFQHLLPLQIAEQQQQPAFIKREPDQNFDEETQEEVYKLAHQAIQMVIYCNQLSSRVLLKCCIRQFPHIRQPAPKLLGYVRNLIRLAESSHDEEISMEIWSLIIDKLLQLDATITDTKDEESRLSFCKNMELHESTMSNDLGDESEIEECENPMEAKIDQMVALIMYYFALKCGESFDDEAQIFGEFASDVNFKSISAIIQQKGRSNSFVFKLLWDAFDEHVLSMIGVHSTPFIWFYICSLSKNNCSSMLEFLWEVLRSPVDSPNEWKKVHNAAAFLCGFLARAIYVDFELVCYWMKKISEWCLEYLEQHSAALAKRAGKNGPIAGAVFQHGTYYAAIQALLFVFCYRHDELLPIMDGEVKSWKLDQLLYNPLDPLHHISQGVALSFLNLNRRLQLVKCSSSSKDGQQQSSRGHQMVTQRRRRMAAAVDLFFPFSFCSLKICSPLILPLMRRFCISSALAPSKPDIGTESDHELFGQVTDDFGPNETNEEAKAAETTKMDGDLIEAPNEEEEEKQLLLEDTSGMLVDEGYEEELMSIQSVSEFGRYLMMENYNKYQQQQQEEDQQEMEV